MTIRKLVNGSFYLLAAFILAFGCSDDGGQPAEETPGTTPPPHGMTDTAAPPHGGIETTSSTGAMIVDTDNDTVPDISDNCPVAANSDQLDNNSDGIGNACETPKGSVDSDGDTIADEGDNCPLVGNSDQKDSNSNGVGDACSLAGTDTGSAGGETDTTGTGGGATDTDAGSGATGGGATGTGTGAGTGFGDVIGTGGTKVDSNKQDLFKKLMDSDKDTIPDSFDNCLVAANQDQLDSDGNKIGDACQDMDNDGILDKNDNCPLVSNADQAKASAKSPYGKACDFDGDTIADEKDNCPYVANISQEACQGVSSGIACDADCDGVLTDKDNCPLAANPDQVDKNDKFNSGMPNGIGDVCDKFDLDNDTVADETDNCLQIANPDQKNTDNDEFGDACDTDIDNDGYPNDVEKLAGSGQGNAESKPSDLDKDSILDIQDNNADGDSLDVTTGDDCNDLDPNVSPDKEDELDDSGKDSNCDGIDGDIVHGKGIVVATDGIDAPNCGTQVQTPCKTISYASDLIGKGGNYANVKYILVAVSDSGKEFTDNFTLPDGVDLRGGYCALGKDKYKTSLSDKSKVPDYFYRTRSIFKCMPTVKNKPWVSAPILTVNGGSGIIEAIHFDYSTSATYFPAAIDIKGGSPLFTLNKIDSTFTGIRVFDPAEAVIDNNTYIKVKPPATPGTYDPDTFILSAVEIDTTKSVKITNNGDISVSGQKAIAINWNLGKKADSASAEIIGNDSISADGVYPKGISLKNLNNAVISNNTSILAKTSKTGATSAGAIDIDSLESVKADSNAHVSLAGITDNIPSVNGYAFSASKVGEVDISGGEYSVSASYSTVINISAIYGYKHLAITDVTISADASHSAYGMAINGEASETEIKGNTITIFGPADNKLKKAYGIELDEKKESDELVGRNKIIDNKFYIQNVIEGFGVKANLIGKNGLTLKDNNILIADGDNLTGVEAKNSDAKGAFRAERNAFIVGKTLNGAALNVSGFNSASSRIDDNLLYGGWLNGTTGAETSAVGLKLSKSSPPVLLNTIIGGTSNNNNTANKPSKVYGLWATFSKLRLLGNIFSAMSTSPVAAGPQCYKYDIFVDGDFNFNSSFMSVHNFFHAPGTGSGKKFGGLDYDGACFTLKVPKINKEEQGVGNINDIKGGWCGFADCFYGNLHAALGLSGGFTNFVFDTFEGIDKVPADTFKNVLGFNIPSSDLRGAPRISGEKADIGAIEYKPGETSVMLLIP